MKVWGEHLLSSTGFNQKTKLKGKVERKVWGEMPPLIEFEKVN